MLTSTLQPRMLWCVLRVQTHSSVQAAHRLFRDCTHDRKIAVLAVGDTSLLPGDTTRSLHACYPMHSERQHGNLQRHDWSRQVGDTRAAQTVAGRGDMMREHMEGLDRGGTARVASFFVSISCASDNTSPPPTWMPPLADLEVFQSSIESLQKFF
jgi:hypothetical protein